MATQLKKTATIASPQNNTVPTIRSLVAALVREINDLLSRGRECMPKDGTEHPTAPFPVKHYTTADLPTASLWEGHIVYDSTTNQFKGSDGAAWNVLG